MLPRMTIAFYDILFLRTCTHCVSSGRWITQRNVMEHLLFLGKPIIEYFKTKYNMRKLTARDWMVTYENWSILDPIDELTVKIQGVGSTHISKITFLIKDLLKIMNRDNPNTFAHRTRLVMNQFHMTRCIWLNISRKLEKLRKCSPMRRSRKNWTP